MRRVRMVGSVAMAVLFWPWTVNATSDVSVSSMQSRVLEVYRENAPGVVRIKSTTEAQNGEGEATPLRVGTGFVISKDGHVLTNASVVHEADHVWAEHQEIPYELEQIGHDPSTNLSLLKFVHPPADLRVIAMDPEVNALETGVFLLAITMPLEFEATPEWGMLTGRESYFGNRFFPVVYYRATIPVGPGSGGAPVFNLQGQLVGVIVASLPDLRSSYILPTRALLRVRDGLLFSGELQYAFLGVEIHEQTGVEFGRRVIVTDVFQGGPAGKAGVLVDDILLEFAGRPILRFNDFVDAVFYTRPGQEVRVVVQRGNERVTMSMRVEKRGSAEP